MRWLKVGRLRRELKSVQLKIDEEVSNYSPCICNGVDMNPGDKSFDLLIERESQLKQQLAEFGDYSDFTPKYPPMDWSKYVPLKTRD